MGQFSWFTQDSGVQIFNDWDTQGDRQTIHMVDPRDGTDYKEEGYEGYGEFDGRDFYELFADINREIIEKYACGLIRDKEEYLAIMNKPYKDLDKDELQKKRMMGIDLWFCYIEPDQGGFVSKTVPLPEGVQILSPILVENYDHWKNYVGCSPESDPNQGWHCCDDEDEESDRL